MASRKLCVSKCFDICSFSECRIDVSLDDSDPDDGILGSLPPHEEERASIPFPCCCINCRLLSNTVNMDRNLRLAFLLIPNALKSPAASARIVPPSSRVLSLATSGNLSEKVSSGMHPHCRAGDVAGVACSSWKNTSTHSPSVQPSWMRRARSLACEMESSVRVLGVWRKEPEKGHMVSFLWEGIGFQRHLAGVPKSVTSSSSSSSSLISSSSSPSVLVGTPSLPTSSSPSSFSGTASKDASSEEPPLAVLWTVSAVVKLASLDSFVIVVVFPKSGSTPNKFISTELPGRSPLGVYPIILAGAPTAVAPDGMGRNTTDPAPILARSPTVMFPRIFVPAPMRTSFPILGCRSPWSFPVPPRVTAWRMVVPSPTRAVSPMTTPEAWSIMTPDPMDEAGWMSTPKEAEAWDWRRRATNRCPPMPPPFSLFEACSASFDAVFVDGFHARRAARCNTKL
mmetsp:Transcript_37560/g.64002  ORF Transcript_37560/g.64002 Transcript_37560/m.64002 type:complete len:454 (+) Transcript_37560:69-1430(+)